jgi:hypothetical protein
MATSDKKTVNHKSQQRTANAKPRKATRKRLVPEVTSPIVATVTPVPITPPAKKAPAGDEGLPTFVASSSSSPQVSTTAASASQPSSATASPPVVGAAPNVTMPTVPPGFTPNKIKSTGLTRITAIVFAALQEALLDFAKSAALTAALGPSAPDPSATAARVEVAMGWRALRDASDLWASYVSSQDAYAWSKAVPSLDETVSRFDKAVALDPTLSDTFPGMSALAQAMNAPQKAAGASRKRKLAKARTVAKAKAAPAASVDATEAPTGTAAPKVSIST